jgi:2-dehydro-3-deoxygluconokinase
MGKVVCFGELLMRLSPELNGEWINKASLPVYIGGAELNVAMALAKWNIPVSYISALPDNYLAKEIKEHLIHNKIDIGSFLQKEGRIGAYYLPQGSDLKNAGVLYDRANSSFSNLTAKEINWDEALKDANWFHFSAICPAINNSIASICKEGLQVAKKKNITISIDLNYRSKLWQYGKQPVEIMPELVSYADIVMGNIWACEKMLGLTITNNNLNSTEDYLNASEVISKVVMKNFPDCKQVANTFRFDKDEGLIYYATLFAEQRLYKSALHQTDYIIDKVGSGDTFMSGLIYGNLNKLNYQETIDYASAAAFNKLFIKGDSTTSSVEAIKKDIYRYA